MNTGPFRHVETWQAWMRRRRVRCRQARCSLIHDLASRLTVAILTAGFATGCSVADYMEPIRELHSAIEISIDSVEALDAQATEVRNARWRAAIVAGQALLTETDQQCADGTAACTLQIEFLDGSESTLYPAITLMPKAKAGLEALRSYVGKLKSIVEADTVGKVTTAANAALGNAQKIEEAIAKANEKESDGTVADFSQPSVAAIGWLVGQYVDYVKYRALAEATRRAQPIVARLASLHRTIGRAVTTLETADALKAFLAAQKQFDDADENGELTPVIVDQYVAAAAAYDISLKASMAAPLEAFSEAHAKLTKQLNREGSTTLSDAYAAIAELRERTEALRSVVDGFIEVIGERKETADGNS